MTTNRPEAAVWLNIPEDCRISGEFTGDHDLHIVFGDVKDGVEMLFERPALERFVRLAKELLAVPMPDDDSRTELPKLYATDATVRTLIKEAGTVVHLRGRPTERP